MGLSSKFRPFLTDVKHFLLSVFVRHLNPVNQGCHISGSESIIDIHHTHIRSA